MRQRLNDNPMFALAAVVLLGIGIAFLFLTRMSGSQPSAAPTATTSTAVAPAGTAPVPDPTATAAAPTSVTPTPVPVTSGAFVAGPGLPKPVVQAYNRGDIVVLLVFKRNGIDDRAVRGYVDQLSGTQDVSIFQTSAKNLTDYSRIAVGVDLNRVPAIVVLEPSRGHVDKDVTPKATVSYGFHGVGSIEQAIRDAQYSGPDNLPTYPR